eukprot:2496526-Pleurochrysis_carterae.AAC.1
MNVTHCSRVQQPPHLNSAKATARALARTALPKQRCDQRWKLARAARTAAAAAAVRRRRRR